VTDSGTVRASDDEREAVVERLRAASAEGRLTLEELTTRTEAAYGARTRGELVEITADPPRTSVRHDRRHASSHDGGSVRRR
jgi:hypothetical protein